MQLLSSWKFYNQSNNEMSRASIWIYNYWNKSLKFEKTIDLSNDQPNRLTGKANVSVVELMWKLAYLNILDCFEYFKYLKSILIVETNSSS